MAMTDGLGVDAAVEAVGVPATFDMCTQLIRPGGTVANVGVHGAPVELALQDLWIKDVSITTGLVSATTTAMLLKLIAQGKLHPEQFVTHRFGLDEVVDAYDTIGRAAVTKALKVALARWCARSTADPRNRRRRTVVRARAHPPAEPSKYVCAFAHAFWPMDRPIARPFRSASGKWIPP